MSTNPEEEISRPFGITKVDHSQLFPPTDVKEEPEAEFSRPFGVVKNDVSQILQRATEQIESESKTTTTIEPPVLSIPDVRSDNPENDISKSFDVYIVSITTTTHVKEIIVKCQLGNAYYWTSPLKVHTFFYPNTNSSQFLSLSINTNLFSHILSI
jgi:hypothetical protein